MFILAGTKEVARAAFDKDECDLWELFGVIKDMMMVGRYELNQNDAQEIEMYNHEDGISYAYVPVK